MPMSMRRRIVQMQVTEIALMPSLFRGTDIALWERTRTVLSHPAVAKRATGCVGALPETRDPGGAAGDHETAVHPTL